MVGRAGVPAVERASVGKWARSHDATETRAQHGGGSESRLRGDFLEAEFEKIGSWDFECHRSALAGLMLVDTRQGRIGPGPQFAHQRH